MANMIVALHLPFCVMRALTMQCFKEWFTQK